MPDIGFLELLLVGIIAFLVLGPERMPELFAQVGRVVRKGRSWIAEVRRQIDEETAPLQSSLHDVEQSVSGIEDYNEAIMKKLGQELDVNKVDARPGTEADQQKDDK
ncbi:MAG: Sec-independent protein translocase protein TatB [Mariprofundus sp.]